MRIPAYIHASRHGIYFFRIVVPRTLRETFDGRTEVRLSLHTRKLRVAMQTARPLAHQLLDLFERAGASMKRNEPTVADLLAKAKKGELRDLRAHKSVTLPNGRVLQYDLETHSTDPAELAAFERQVEAERKELREAEMRYYEKDVDVPQAMKEYQEKQAKQMAEFRAELRAQVETEKAQVASGTVQSGAAAHVAKAASGTKMQPPNFTGDPENVLSLRWKEYLGLTGDIDWKAPRTLSGNEKKFMEFWDWWGKDDDIRAIDRPLINKFILHLKSGRVVEKGPRRGVRGLGGRTVDNYTSVLNKFLTWAQEKGHYPDERKLPTEGQALVSRSARNSKGEKANPIYTMHQLSLIFDPKRYQFNLAHHWWPPLLALFTGGRRRELSQLLVHDFITVDGIPALSIDDLGDDDKSVKTRAARRTIPVHPQLIELGLLDYVEDVKALGIGPELFPGIGANKYGEKGGAVGTAWGRYVHACGIVGKKTPTYHSFRATAIDVLKKNGVDLDMRCQLVGHEFDHVSENYNPNKFSVAKLMTDGVPKLIFEGLDLSALRYQRGRFDASNRDEAVKAAEREAFIEENRIREEKGLPKLNKSDWKVKVKTKTAVQATSGADGKNPFTIKVTRNRQPKLRK